MNTRGNFDIVIDGKLCTTIAVEYYFNTEIGAFVLTPSSLELINWVTLFFKSQNLNTPIRPVYSAIELYEVFQEYLDYKITGCGTGKHEKFKDYIINISKRELTRFSSIIKTYLESLPDDNIYYLEAMNILEEIRIIRK